MNNKMKLTFSAISENESFARGALALFALRLNPSVAEIADIKTAVSEAVTNAIVHAYPHKSGDVELSAVVNNDEIHITVKDFGVGIENLEGALLPFYTTKIDEEHAGMGFTIMKTFMDEVIVKSKKGEGTEVYMKKKIMSDEKKDAEPRSNDNSN